MPLSAAVAIADLAQHPADRFVDEIVRVGDENGRDAQRVVEIVAADGGERGEHGDAALPQRRGARQPVEQRGIARPDDLRSGAVDEIPIVDAMGVAQ
jgi:hypothetical protein